LPAPLPVTALALQQIQEQGKGRWMVGINLLWAIVAVVVACAIQLTVVLAVTHA
jgi:hypothetical protein